MVAAHYLQSCNGYTASAGVAKPSGVPMVGECVARRAHIAILGAPQCPRPKLFSWASGLQTCRTERWWRWVSPYPKLTAKTSWAKRWTVQVVPTAIWQRWLWREVRGDKPPHRPCWLCPPTLCLCWTGWANLMWISLALLLVPHGMPKWTYPHMGLFM